MSKEGACWGFGLVGCGVIAREHARALTSLANARLVAVTDVVAEKAKALADQSSCEVVKDLDELLSRADVDAVSICVPSGLHAEIGVRAAEAGKHLVVEKPIDVTLEAADRLIAAVHANNVVMTVVSNRRFLPGAQQVHDLIKEGRLGRLLVGDARVKWYRSQAYYDGDAWRGTWALDGGGALMNQGVHYVDLLRWCMGPVREVSAVCVTVDHDIEVEDVALAHLLFGSGAIGSIEVSTCIYPGLTECLEISGSDGTVVLENDALVLRSLRSEQGEPGPYGGKAATAQGAASSVAADPAAAVGNSHARQIADFLGAIEEGREPLMSGAEGRAALEVILAIYQSARRRGPVSLPLDLPSNDGANLLV